MNQLRNRYAQDRRSNGQTYPRGERPEYTHYDESGFTPRVPVVVYTELERTVKTRSVVDCYRYAAALIRDRRGLGPSDQVYPPGTYDSKDVELTLTLEQFNLRVSSIVTYHS